MVERFHLMGGWVLTGLEDIVGAIMCLSSAVVNLDAFKDA